MWFIFLHHFPSARPLYFYFSYFLFLISISLTHSRYFFLFLFCTDQFLAHRLFICFVHQYQYLENNLHFTPYWCFIFIYLYFFFFFFHFAISSCRCIIRFKWSQPIARTEMVRVFRFLSFFFSLCNFVYISIDVYILKLWFRYFFLRFSSLALVI